MPTIEIADGAIRNEVLVIGFAIKKNGTFVIESGDLALDEKPLVQALKDLGATAKSDEILKVPGSTTRLMVFTSLGAESKKYAPEILRRAAGSASRALAGNASVAFPYQLLILNHWEQLQREQR